MIWILIFFAGFWLFLFSLGYFICIFVFRRRKPVVLGRKPLFPGHPGNSPGARR